MRFPTFITAAVCGLLIALGIGLARPAWAAEIRVLNANALTIALRALAAEHTKQTGNQVTFIFGYLGSLQGIRRDQAGVLEQIGQGVLCIGELELCGGNGGLSLFSPADAEQELPRLDLIALDHVQFLDHTRDVDAQRSILLRNDLTGRADSRLELFDRVFDRRLGGGSCAAGRQQGSRR